MTYRAVIALAAAILVGKNLIAFCLRNDFTDDCRSLKFATNANTSAFTDKKHVVKSNFSSGFAFEFLNCKDFTRADAVLLTACFENCV